MKRDGHTHTEYCPHGQIEDTEKVIQKAIELDFKEYSITEHAPLPPSILELSGGERKIWTTSSMALNDLTHYFKKMTQLKKKYASDIKINIGFELDYFESTTSWTTDFLNEFGALLDDNILSVHFLNGAGGYRSIDYSLEDYRQGIVEYYGSFLQAQEAYLQTLLQSIQADLGPWKPIRIGHISLCRKFFQAFNEPTEYTNQHKILVSQILDTMSKQNYSLDLNTAGLYKEFCGETYPPKWITQLAKEKNIPLIYGSDTHSLEDINRGYSNFENYL